jgi:hypothetical protein
MALITVISSAEAVTTTPETAAGRQRGGRSGIASDGQAAMGWMSDTRYRPTIPIIGRVVHALIVERQLGTFEHHHVVIGLYEVFRA